MFIFIPFLGGKQYNQLSVQEKKKVKRNILIVEIIIALFGLYMLIDTFLSNNSMFLLPGIILISFAGLLYYNTYRLN